MARRRKPVEHVTVPFGDEGETVTINRNAPQAPLLRLSDDPDDVPQTTRAMSEFFKGALVSWTLRGEDGEEMPLDPYYLLDFEGGVEEYGAFCQMVVEVCTGTTPSEKKAIERAAVGIPESAYTGD